MNIKMPIKFHGNYVLTIQAADSQSRERCQKLTVRELSSEEAAAKTPESSAAKPPTHLITFYDFGCKRVVEGCLRENESDKLVFLVDDKEYTFAPYVPDRLRKPQT